MGEIFEPEGIYARYSGDFSKILPLSKNGGHFEFLTKMVKLKIA